MPAFGQSRDEKIDALQTMPKPKAFSTTETNTLPVSNIGIVNLEQKKKPHNIQIKNNKKEPKITPNVKYTDKQRFRKYKTRTEPNLHSKIEINEEDDIVNKIKEAFGIKSEKQNTNYSEEITAPAPFNNGVDEPPEIETKIYSRELKKKEEPYEGYNEDRLYFDDLRTNRLLYELDDISPETRQELTFQEDSPDEYYDGWKDKEIIDKNGKYRVIQIPVKINKRTRQYAPEDFGQDLLLQERPNPLKAMDEDTFGDDEVSYNSSSRRLSGAETPQRKYKSPILNKREERKAGRPKGTLGGQALIRKNLEAINLSENREATLKDFKEIKRSNIANKKPEMKYKDFMNQLNRNDHSVLKYYDKF